MSKEFIRLYRFIHSNLNDLTPSELTFSEIKQNILKYGVLINKALVFEQLYKFYPNIEKVDISHWPLRPKGNFQDLVILYESQEILVINKPKNLVVQPGAGHLQDNLITYFKESRDIDIFLINRIDKETCGIMLIAKSEIIQKKYQNLFKERIVKKEYFALVVGDLQKVYNLTHFQTRDTKNPIKQKLFWDHKTCLDYSPLQVRECKTLIKPVFYCQELDISLINVEIFTGRMHQIRLVCQEIGFPLFQESIYNQNIEVKNSNSVNNCSFYSLNFQSKIISPLELQVFILKYSQCHSLKNENGYFLCSKFTSFSLGNTVFGISLEI